MRERSGEEKEKKEYKNEKKRKRRKNKKKVRNEKQKVELTWHNMIGGSTVHHHLHLSSFHSWHGTISLRLLNV